jgi:hypothetical protein
MKPFVKYIITIVYILILNHTIHGQERTWENTQEGEIENASFLVEKERQIELPVEVRRFEKIQVIPNDLRSLQVQPYSYSLFFPDMKNIRIRNRAFRLKDEPLEKLYGGSFTAGFGNYVTPYLELDYYNKRENQYLVGVNLTHFSSRNGPVDKQNSGNGYSSLKLSSKFFSSTVTGGASLKYKRSFYHFYGYPESSRVDEDSIRRKFNHITLSANLENNAKEDDFDYDLQFNFDYFNDNFNSRESDVNLTLKSGVKLEEDLHFSLDGDLNIINYKFEENINRNLIRLKPSIFYQYNEFDLYAGLNFVIQNDTLESRGNVLLYPMIMVDYHLNDYFNMFLKFDGDLEKRTFRDIAYENPAVVPGAPLLHSNKKFGLNWGIKGNVMNFFNFTAGFSLSEYKDMYFYLNDSTDISVFNLLYDYQNTSLVNIYGELVFSKVQRYHLSLRGDYFNYSTKQLEVPWHKPSYRISTHLNYSFYEKIIFGANIYFSGGIRAFDWTTDRTITLDPIVDLNLDINYRFSDQLGAFIKFDNIFGNNYQRYYRYPVRGIQVMIGANLNF